MTFRNHGLRSLASALLVLSAGAPFLQAQEDVIELYDGFDDGELFDGTPVDWNSAMTRVAAQRGGKRRIRDGWLQTWNDGDWSVETTTRRVFEGDVSVRMLARSVGKPGTFLNVIAHGAPGRGYLGTLQDDEIADGFPGGYIGNASILRIDSDNNAEILAAIEIDEFDSNDEYILQLDVSGDDVEFRVWRPNEAFPEEPLLLASDNRYRSGEAGVSAYYPRGQRGNGVTRYLEVDYMWIRNEMLGDDVPPLEPETMFLRGDCNSDGAVDISDVSCVLNWLFAGEAQPGCLAALNANGDSVMDIADAVSLLNFLFGGGPIITAPFPDCGPLALPADKGFGCANPPDCQ